MDLERKKRSFRVWQCVCRVRGARSDTGIAKSGWNVVLDTEYGIAIGRHFKKLNLFGCASAKENAGE